VKKIFKPKTSFKGRTANSASTGSLAQKLALVNESVKRNTLPDFRPGDTVKVHVRIKEGDKERIQIFEGAVISRKRRGRNGMDDAFTVRKISHGTGVERVFQDCSPKVSKVEVVQRGKVRRSKLYYLRSLEGRAAKIERDIQATMADKAAERAAAKKAE